MKTINYKYSYVEVKNGKEIIREDSFQRKEYYQVGRAENLTEAVLNSYGWAIGKKNLAVTSYADRYNCNKNDIEIKFNESKIRIEIYKNGELVEFIKFEEIQ